MADDDLEISELVLAASFTSAAEFPGLLGGLNRRFNGQQVADYIGAATFVSPHVVSPYDFGAIADDGSHPLSGYYASLAQAQTDFPFATDLAQQFDYCACKQASNVAFGADGFENGPYTPYLNKELWVPKGAYWFGDDTWTIRNLVGGVIRGGGRYATNLRGNKTALFLHGVWYTEVSNLSIRAEDADAIAAFELDGNIVGEPYDTRGIQGITLRNIVITSPLATYGWAMCRQGGSFGQGSECTFLNVHTNGGTLAGYYQNGYNALQNNFYGGNFQSFLASGILVEGGTVGVFGVGFQANKGYRQIENLGWDIEIGVGGVYDGVSIFGCRTESLRFLKNWGAVKVDVRACTGLVGISGWAASTEYGAAAPLYKGIVEKQTIRKLFVATTPGTSHATVEPDWGSVAEGGTIADNGIVWTHVPFSFIEVALGGGTVNLDTVSCSAGDIIAPTTSSLQRTVDSTSTLFLRTLTIHDSTIVADATAAAVEVIVPVMVSAQTGKQFTVKKSDASANTVTVNVNPASSDGDSTAFVIPGGTRGSVTIEWAKTALDGTSRWILVAKV